MAETEVYIDDVFVGYERDGVFIPYGTSTDDGEESESADFETVMPVIAEGRRGAIMPDTHHLTVHRSGDGGLEPFTLEKSKRLGTKHISENGVYKASDDDLYAWSKVSVNVFGGVGNRGEVVNGGDYVPTIEIDGVEVPVGGDGSGVHYDGYVLVRGVGNEVSGSLDGTDSTIKCFSGSYINGFTGNEEIGRLLDISAFMRSYYHYLLIDCSGSMDDGDKRRAIQSSLISGHRYAVYVYGGYGEERLIQSFTTDLRIVNFAILEATKLSLGGYETYQAFLEERLNDTYLSTTEIFTDEDPYQSYGSGPSTRELIALYTAKGNEIIIHELG